MAQNPIELILLRQLAGYLATPIFFVAPDEKLLFFNDAAETLTGLRYDEVGSIPLELMRQRFQPVDESGAAIPWEDVPVSIALRHRRPAHLVCWVLDTEHRRRRIEAVATPIVGLGNRFLGVMQMFWEVSDP